MSAIHDLIAQVSDPRLRERLAAEWASASKEKKFGLVFEDHLPELLPLYKARPRRGDLVCRRDGSLKDVWQVQQVKERMRQQHLRPPAQPGRQLQNIARAEREARLLGAAPQHKPVALPGEVVPPPAGPRPQAAPGALRQLRLRLDPGVLHTG